MLFSFKTSNRPQVHKTAAQDIDAAVLRNKAKWNGGGLLDGNPLYGDSEAKPWLRNHTKPCTYTICPRCRPGAAERAFISLDGVADGDVAPTAAVGYGFHSMGYRPVVDANILRTIGDRETMAVRTPVICSEPLLTRADPSKRVLPRYLIQFGYEHVSYAG